MRRLIILLLAITSLQAQAQILNGPQGYGKQEYRYRALNFLGLPVHDTICDLVVNGTNGTCEGAVVYKPEDSTLYVRTSTYWRAIAKGTGSLADYYTKIQSDARFVHYTDTASMLSKYFRNINGITGPDLLFTTGTSGTDVNVGAAGSTITINVPDASSTQRGVVTTGFQTFAGSKVFANNITLQNVPAMGSAASLYFVSNGGVVNTRTPSQLLSDAGGVPTTRTLTMVAGTDISVSPTGAQDLSANRSWTISNTANLQTTTDRGSITSNMISIVRDSAMLLFQHASPGAQKNAYQRYADYLNSRELGFFGFREAVFADSSFRRINRVGPIVDDGLTGFSWRINNTEIGKVNSSGQWGLGVDPAAKLHVSGTIRFDLGSDATYDVFYRNSSGFVTRLPLGPNGSFLGASSGTLAYITPAFVSLSPGADQTGFYRLTGNCSTTGSLWVGTNSGAAKFQINNGTQVLQFGTGTNTSGYTFSLGANDDGVNFATNVTSRGYNFKNSTSTLMTITATGTVGVNETTVGAQLDVKGTSSSTGSALRVRNSTPATVFQVDNNGDVTLFNSLKLLTGSGSPEGVKTAPVGSFYLRTDGSAGATMYVKESGSGNTGWMKVTTSAP